MLKIIFCSLFICNTVASCPMKTEEDTYTHKTSIKQIVLDNIGRLIDIEKRSVALLFENIHSTRNFFFDYEQQVEWNIENKIKICKHNDFDTATFVFEKIYKLGESFLSKLDNHGLIQIAITLAFINEVLNTEGEYETYLLGSDVTPKISYEQLSENLQRIANLHFKRLLDLIEEK